MPCPRFAFLLLLCSLGLPQTPALAQAAPEDAQQLSRPRVREIFRVQHFNTADGLPSNAISSILEDHLGFLWLGSGLGGLVRYDGHTFETFRARQGDTTSIGGSAITTLHEDAAGNIWAGGHPRAPQGVSRFDRRTERFTRYRHDPDDPNSLVHDGVLSIHSSPREPGIVWIAAHSINSFSGMQGGISRLDVETGTFTNYPWHSTSTDFVNLQHDVNTLIEDSDGVLWAGGWGLNRFDPVTGAFIPYLPAPTLLPSSTSLPRNYFETVFAAPTEPGVLWAGGYRGLHRLDVATETFTAFFPFPDDPLDVRNRVSSILEDQTGTLWVGTDGGLFTFDRETERFTRFEHQPASPAIWAITEDRFGVLWMGSSVGLMKLERRTNPFTVHEYDPDAAATNVRAVYTDEEGLLWIGRPDGLQRIDRRTGKVTSFIHDPDDPTSLAPGQPMNPYEDRDGAFWVPGTCGFGGYAWLNKMDRQTGRFTRYGHNPDDPQSISEGCINAVLEDRNGDFWVVTWGGGLNKMDRQTGRFTHYRHDPDDPQSLVNDFILRIYEDPAGTLWLGTENGLSRFDPATETFTNYQDDLLVRVMMMHEDRDGRFWVATAQAAGCTCFDRETGAITESVHDRRRPGQQLRVVRPRRPSRSALAQHRRAASSRFDPETTDLPHLYCPRRTPLQRPLLKGRTTRAARRRIVLRFGAQGVVSFYPEQLERNPTPPEVVLTGFRIAGTRAAIGPEGPLEASITLTENAHAHVRAERPGTFEYVGLHSLDPSQNRLSVPAGGLRRGLGGGRHAALGAVSAPAAGRTMSFMWQRQPAATACGTRRSASVSA